MIIERTLRIKAPVRTVWETLNDVPFVASCMPGVQDVKMVGANTYQCKLKAKVAYISVTFDMELVITKRQEPVYMETVAQGKALAGMGRVSQRQSLELRAISDNETEALYKGELTTVGRLASVGAKAIPRQAEEMADEFSKKFVAGCEAKVAKT